MTKVPTVLFSAALMTPSEFIFMRRKVARELSVATYIKTQIQL